MHLCSAKSVTGLLIAPIAACMAASSASSFISDYREKTISALVSAHRFQKSSCKILSISNIGT
jgi:hypothetical protein